MEKYLIFDFDGVIVTPGKFLLMYFLKRRDLKLVKKLFHQ